MEAVRPRGPIDIATSVAAVRGARFCIAIRRILSLVAAQGRPDLRKRFGHRRSPTRRVRPAASGVVQRSQRSLRRHDRLTLYLDRYGGRAESSVRAGKGVGHRAIALLGQFQRTLRVGEQAIEIALRRVEAKFNPPGPSDAVPEDPPHSDGVATPARETERALDLLHVSTPPPSTDSCARHSSALAS